MNFLRLNKKKVLPVILLILGHSVFAQTPISLQAAIDTALTHSAAIQSAKIKTMAAQKLEGSAVDLPTTATTLEYGNINSGYADTKAGISQSFSFPVVYRRQRQLLEAQTLNFKLSEKEVEWQLKKEITSLYYQVLLLQEKKNLLLQADSLFQSFLKKQEQRFAAGDINVLEKTAAETQRMQIAAQLQQLEAELAGQLAGFRSLMNTDLAYTPIKTAAKAVLSSLPDASVISSHPALQLKMQQQQIALQEIEVEKSKLLPRLSLGYANQSIRGLQTINGVEKFYTAGHRFSSVTVGIDIPLFAKPAKARIAAGKYQHESLKAEYNEAERQQKTALEQWLLRYQNNKKQLEYYEQHALKQARLLREHSTLQLNSGEISYMEWMLLVHQSIQLEAGYFTTLAEWNATVIELNAFINY